MSRRSVQQATLFFFVGGGGGGVSQLDLAINQHVVHKLKRIMVSL